MESKGNTNLVAAASTDLVNRISNEINYIFKHRYTELGDGKREQTNPYVSLSDAEQTEVIVESITMVLGQIAAMAMMSETGKDQQSIYGLLSKKVRTHGDAYHQHFLQMKETQEDEQQANSKEP